MPRVYKDLKPSSNKAVTPAKETKEKPSAPDKDGKKKEDGGK